MSDYSIGTTRQNVPRGTQMCQGKKTNKHKPWAHSDPTVMWLASKTTALFVMMCIWTGACVLTNAAVLFPRGDWLWRGAEEKHLFTSQCHSLLAVLDFLCGLYGPAPMHTCVSTVCYGWSFTLTLRCSWKCSDVRSELIPVHLGKALIWRVLSRPHWAQDVVM